MRRILGLQDSGEDVAMIQETLNDLMPFARPAPRIVSVGTIWEQVAAQRAAIANGTVCPLNGPFDIPSWGTVRDWNDLNYTWGYGGLAAARNLDGGMPPTRLTGDVTPHNYQMIAVDGEFGPMTEKVVKQFQRLSGLPADGILGPATWDVVIPTSVFTVLAPKDQPAPKKKWVWRKPNDKYGCYDDQPVVPGKAQPGPGYHMEQKDDDDHESGLKVEVQSGIQTGDARYFLLGQIIAVYPRGPGDTLGFLPGHTEMAVGVQYNVGDSVQIFASLTRANLVRVTGKYVTFSLDAMVQPYAQVRTSPTGHGGAGVQSGATANLNLTPLIKKLLGDDTKLDAALFVQGAVQGQYGVDPNGNGSFGVTLPVTGGLKVNW